MASTTAVVAATAARRWSSQDVVWVGAVVVPTAAVSVAAMVTGDNTAAGAAAITGCAFVLTVLACIDVRWRILPNVIVYPALAVAVAVAFVRTDQSLVEALAGAAFAASPFLFAYFLITDRPVPTRSGSHPRRTVRGDDVKWAGLAGAGGVLLAALVQADQPMGGAIAAAIVAGSPFVALSGDEGRSRREVRAVVPTKRARGIGGGDVKLAALLGAIAGVPGVLAALTVAVVGGACAAVALMMMRRGGGAIPYGPLLAAGAIVGMV